MEKREKLLKTALKLFAQNGFNQTPTSRIAKEAGIATGTLFYFFPTKDDLIKSLYIEIKNRASDYILIKIKESTSVKEIIKIYYVESLNWALKNDTEFQFLSQFSNSPYLQKIASTEMQTYIEPVLKNFRIGIKTGVIIPQEPILLYVLISNQVIGIKNYLNKQKLSKKTTQLIIEQTFDLFWKMIAL